MNPRAVLRRRALPVSGPLPLLATLAAAAAVGAACTGQLVGQGRADAPSAGAPDGPAGPPVDAGRCGGPRQACCQGELCAGSLLCCDGVCADTLSDPDNCGLCGAQCAAACALGACEDPECGWTGQPCCGTSPPCGTGLQCSGGTCQPVSTCLPVGSPCSGGCCADLSCRASPSQALCCAEAGDACGSSADCCGWMGCQGGTCLCQAQGSSCATAEDCCDGRPCAGGTCGSATDPCSSSTDCLACTSRTACGFCSSSGACQTGTSSGPASGSCANWDWTQSQCPDPCAGPTDCAACAAGSGCGYCVTSSLCQTGDASGPDLGYCSSWEYGPSACEPDHCANRTDAPIRPKVVLIVLNPRIEAEGGRKLTEVMGWQDPYALTNTLIEDVRRASCGYVDYQLYATREYDSFPQLRDGFRYNDTTFLACIRDPDHSDCHVGEMDYLWFMQTYSVIADINAGATEVWLWGAPYFGPDEYAGKIPGDAPYSTPACNDAAAYWFYRPKNLPDLGRTYWVMGFSYERGVSEMEESYIHRIEGTLSIELAGCRWLPNGTDPWSKFTWIDLHMPGQARCGARHFAPNSQSDYDWANTRTVSSSCDDYYNYPALPNTRVSMTCTPWNCNGEDHADWWMAHLPHAAGTTGGKQNNWWKYIADYDRW